MQSTQTRKFSPDIIKLLPNWLQEPLPGLDAQLHMAPPHRATVLEPHQPYRDSAVLMLLYAHRNELTLLFTRRPQTLKHHAGEICFPGGGHESQDTDLNATALRETEEEIGIPRQRVSLLGVLTPLYIAPSKNLVHPFVGWVEQLPPLTPNVAEVEEILQVPFNVFFDRSYLDTHIWQYHGEKRHAPCFMYQGACIWGATAMMLNELLEVMQSHSTTA